MMRELKLGFGLMRYGYNWKQLMVTMAVFDLVGVAFFFLPSMGSFGPIYWAVGVSFFQQSLGTLSLSSLGKSAPVNKALQTSVAVILGVVLNLIVYTLIAAMRMLVWRLDGKTEPYPTEELVLIAGLLLITGIYYAMMYKVGKLGYLLWIILIVVSIMGIQQVVGVSAVFWPTLSVGTAFGMGIGLILLGGFLQYGIACLLYRHSFGFGVDRMIRQMEKFR